MPGNRTPVKLLLTEFIPTTYTGRKSKNSLFFSAERLKISVNMKILLHICCAPCAIYPVQELRTGGMDVTGFFYNHNIHPFQEYRRRLETVRKYAGLVELEVIYRDEYPLEGFLANVAANPDQRCLYCYSSRLEIVAAAAVQLGFEAFTTSLLYSRYQKHEVIREMGSESARSTAFPFIMRISG